jgi:glycosyltransferase involved in cell wall biosynthesis
MAPKRILVVAPSAYPLGGVAIWLNYLLPGLARRGWQPILGLVQGHWHDVGKYGPAMPKSETISIPNPTGSHEGRLRALAGAIRDTAPALLLAVNIPDCYAAVARLRATGRPAPRVAMALHGIQPDLYEDVCQFRDVLDGVIATNRLACALTVASDVERERVHYAPCGVDLPQLPSRVEEASGTPLRLAFVGRLEEWQKRLSDLAGIVAELDRRGVNFELVIAGSGPDEASLATAVHAQLAQGRIKFLGDLAASEVSDQVYLRADVLLVTSRWETGPLVIWEAMASGVAVATSRFVGAGLEGSLQDDGNCLLFPVGDVGKAADAIVRLQDATLRMRLAARARERVQARYSRNASIDAWSRAAEAVLASAPLPGPVAAPAAEPAGRLDEWFGTASAETIRKFAGLTFRHRDAGGEWPHSYGHSPMDDVRFWNRAAALDEARL